MIIQADMHTHTVASTHAFSTVMEMAKAASDEGLSALAFTDHSTGGEDAPHIWHFHNLPKAIPRKLFGVNMVFGVECDIIDDKGTLALPNREFEFLDWVVASIHGTKLMSGHDRDYYTSAYVNASKNPYVDVIGHPVYPHVFGDYDVILPEFKKNDKLVEINESAIIRSDEIMENCRDMIRRCKALEIPVIVDSDAHFCLSVGKFDAALKLLEEEKFPEELVVNTSWERIKERIEKRKGKIFE